MQLKSQEQFFGCAKYIQYFQYLSYGLMQSVLNPSAEILHANSKICGKSRLELNIEMETCRFD